MIARKARSIKETNTSIVQQAAAQLPAGYKSLLGDLKKRIRNAQLRAARAANHELVLLYWHIGNEILQRQNKEGWGTKIIERLGRDLKQEFPDIKGFSPRNIKYMRAFAETYPDRQFVQEVLAQITWYHNLTLIEKIKDGSERLWYIRKTIENGWSRNVLVLQIEGGLYHRQGKAVTNFKQTLPSPQSDLAKQTLKDPYVFDFLSLTQKHDEKELERGLTEHLQKFLIELGAGFAFVGRQYHIEVGKDDFYIDLLFYHLKLRCYVVIELKKGKFQPAYAGQLNFYLNAVDDKLRHPDDQPSIGLVLCQDRNRIVAEYALKGIEKAIGVSEYQLTRALPENLKSSLPTIEELEAELIKS